MKAWIIYNGLLPGDKFRDFAEMLQLAAIKRGHDAVLIRSEAIVNDLHHQKDVFFKEDIAPDYVLFTDKDIYLAKQLELLGIPVYNDASTIEISDDKIKTYQYLNKYHLPIPRTVVAPKTFGFKSSLDSTYLDSIITLFGFPLVIKEAFGSFGEQVYLVHNRKELEAYTDKLSNVPYLFQQFIKTSFGKDIRLQVVGNKVVCGMLRKSKDDFRANITNGGEMYPYEPNDLEITTAVAASKAIGADFSGVDLLFGESGQPIVCEVNSNAHIRNLLDCTNINAATAMIAYIDKKQKEVPNS